MTSRLVWSFLFLAPLAVTLTALQLVPDPAGHSTHTQLGLPPCGFLLVTGLPCPGCGLTTSFAHMVRAEVVGAAMANPFGVLLFLLSFLTMPVALFGFVRGLPVMDTLDRLCFERWALLLITTCLVVWLVRVGTISLGL